MHFDNILHPGLARRFVPLVLALAALVASPAASTADETGVIERLLVLPTHADSASGWPEPPPPLDVEPGETGSDLALLSHWGERGGEEEPPAETRWRLLDAALEHPDWLPHVLQRLPQEPEAFDRVKLVYDSAPAQRWYSERWGEKVGSWLMLNSEHLRDELIEVASKARDAEGGYVKHAEELEALARIDWDAAVPVLARLAESGDARTRTLALSLQYRHVAGTDPSKAEDLREAPGDHPRHVGLWVFARHGCEGIARDRMGRPRRLVPGSLRGPFADGPARSPETSSAGSSTSSSNTRSTIFRDWTPRWRTAFSMSTST